MKLKCKNIEFKNIEGESILDESRERIVTNFALSVAVAWGIQL